MNIAICRLMGLALGPQLPPLDVKSVIRIINESNLHIPSVFRVFTRLNFPGRAWLALQDEYGAVCVVQQGSA